MAKICLCIFVLRLYLAQYSSTNTLPKHSRLQSEVYGFLNAVTQFLFFFEVCISLPGHRSQFSCMYVLLEKKIDVVFTVFTDGILIGIEKKKKKAVKGSKSQNIKVLQEWS